jgi:hypothetical protein
VRAYQRCYGYIFFLTSTYPPFSLEEDPDYVMASRLEQGKLVRMKVLFRLILMIPVLVVTWGLGYGLFLLGFVSWLTLLIRGTLPKPMHDAVVAIIRFQGRVLAYVLLLQDPYPRGLFGDKATTVDDDAVLQADRAETESEPTPSQLPVADATSEELSSGDEGAPISDSVPLLDSTIAQTSEDSALESAGSWALILTTGTKRIIVLALVVGVIAAGIYVSFVPHWGVQQNLESNISASAWTSQYRGDVVSLRSAMSGFDSTFDAKHPNWSAVLNDCQVLQIQYAVFDSVPYYPLAGPDDYLIAGLRAVYAGSNDCVSIVAPYKVSKALPYLAKQFNESRADFKVFLEQSQTSSTSQALYSPKG